MLQHSPTCYVCPACGRAIEVLVPVGEAPRCARCDRLMKPPLRLALGRTGPPGGGPGPRSTGAADREPTPLPPGKPPARPVKPVPGDAPHQLALFGGES